MITIVDVPADVQEFLLTLVNRPAKPLVANPSDIQVSLKEYLYDYVNWQKDINGFTRPGWAREEIISIYEGRIPIRQSKLYLAWLGRDYDKQKEMIIREMKEIINALV